MALIIFIHLSVLRTHRTYYSFFSCVNSLWSKQKKNIYIRFDLFSTFFFSFSCLVVWDAFICIERDDLLALIFFLSPSFHILLELSVIAIILESFLVLKMFINIPFDNVLGCLAFIRMNNFHTCLFPDQHWSVQNNWDTC